MRKISCIFGFLVFSLFTYWQLNDATQYKTEQVLCLLWVTSYASIALLSLICAFRKLPNKAFLLLALVPFVIALFRFTYIDWNYDNVLYNPDNPAANETGGLIIMALWLLALSKVNTKDIIC